MIRFVVLAMLMFAGATASADELRPGYLEFTQTGSTSWKLIWKAPMKGGVTPATQPVLPAGCEAHGQPRREFGNSAVVTTVRVICAKPVSGQQIGLTGFAASQTDVLVRVAPLGRPVQAMRLNIVDALRKA